jgi:hypothetical protein
MSAAPATDPTASRFESFALEAADTSPLYASLARLIAETPALRAVFALPADRHPTLAFAAVQRVLADHPDAPLAAYYASFGGRRAPDADLPKAFESFVADQRAEVETLVATGDTQTNEPLRAAQLRPALGWAQACFGRSLGLIEVGASAGFLLHPERYAYEYGFDDGSVLEQPAVADPYDDSPAIVLSCPVRGAATPKTLAPFVAKDLRIASRVGLDLNPLDPADAATRAWLRALVWPEEAERLARLDAALAMAARHPVRLRKGNALDILDAAVATVKAPAVPCVFVSNALAHFSATARVGFVALIRALGAQQDLVLILEEAASVGLGLFAEPPAEPSADRPAGPQTETLAAVFYQAGRERRAVLGAAGAHGAWLDWAPRMV